jgi:uncharacterized protein
MPSSASIARSDVRDRRFSQRGRAQAPVGSAKPTTERRLAQHVWPDSELDVATLKETGWVPTPFNEIVLKMHSWCDLACDYCYVFEMADASWQNKPRRIGPDVIEQTAARIGAHVTTHELPGVRVVLHGGEPLLAGHDLIAGAAAALRRALPAGTDLDLRMQTNGVRLTESVLRMLFEQRVQVSVSLDGDRATHDKHRKYRRGKGSFDDVAVTLRLLGAEPFRQLFAGLLCTIDVTANPIRIYDALLEFAPPTVDFLLPHGNWDSPPPSRAGDSAATPYADWLITIFELWYGAPVRQTRIRLFEEIIVLLLGGSSRLESIGLNPVSLLVVDTDGSMEQVDTLKSAFHGAPATGLNVFDHDFDAALELPAIAARQIGLAALADQCRVCPVVRICGGGYYPHRYRAGHGFREPSVFCPDLFRLITHIDRRVAADLASHATSES